MNKTTELVDRYFAMWNETDAKRRRHLIASIWTESASYVDPAVEGKSQEGIDGMVKTIQERFPEHRFRRTSEVDCHHNRLRFRWELAPKDGAVLVGGTDFGILGEDGRLQEIVGFFDQAPAVP
ncbi:MAG: nuclear transport factor 2 family protein [Methylobacteriaceae bacterium]|nr:nuclear transport factor 2 family protein [Methylobacteriaceae bacterium]